MVRIVERKSSLRTGFRSNATTKPQQLYLEDAYHHWNGGQVKEKFRLNKGTFDFNLTITQPVIDKTSNDLVFSFIGI